MRRSYLVHYGDCELLAKAMINRPFPGDSVAPARPDWRCSLATWAVRADGRATLELTWFAPELT